MIVKWLRRRWQAEFNAKIEKDEAVRREVEKKLRAIELETELWRRAHKHGGRA